MGGVALAPSAAGSAGNPSRLPAFEPAVQLRHWLRLVADLSGRVVHQYTAGTVYGFRPQADDVSLAAFARPLYGYRAVLARQVLGRDGDGWRVRQRGWTHYVDRASGTPVESLVNPYTDERVACPPMSFPTAEIVYRVGGSEPRTAPLPAETSDDRRAFHLDYTAVGARVEVRREVFSRFRTPDITWFKLEADVTVYDAPRAALLDADPAHLPTTYSHSLVAEWQTWMKMHGQPGHILFSGMGRTLARLDDLPVDLRTALEQRFPGTLEASTRWRAGAHA